MPCRPTRRRIIASRSRGAALASPPALPRTRDREARSACSRSATRSRTAAASCSGESRSSPGRCGWRAGSGCRYTSCATDGGRVSDVVRRADPRLRAAHSAYPGARYELGCLYIGVNDVRALDWDAGAFEPRFRDGARLPRRALRPGADVDRAARPRAPAGRREGGGAERGWWSGPRPMPARWWSICAQFGARNLVMADHVHPTAFGQIAIAERALAVLERDGLAPMVRPSDARLAMRPTRWNRLRGDATYAFRSAKVNAGRALVGSRVAARLPLLDDRRPSVDLPQPPPERRRQRPRRELPAPGARRSPGRFIRASLPRPSTSCACTIATRAGEEKARRISAHHGSALRGSRDAASSASSSRACRRGSSDSYQPARGVVVVRAGVDDAVLDVVARAGAATLGSLGLEGQTAAPASRAARARRAGARPRA